MRATIFFFLIVLAPCVQLNAQKLPNKQERSVWAPPNPKIDGQTDEWNNKFEAYNRATEVFYTIANDDNYIYLIAQAVSPRIAQKILEGGVTFRLTTNKHNTDWISITFPLISKKDNQPIIYNSQKKRVMAKDSNINKVLNDSILLLTNKLLKNNLKHIRINGITGDDITDTVEINPSNENYFLGLPMHQKNDRYLLINNNDGIKTAAEFTRSRALNIKFAIPLKFFNSKGIKLNKIWYGVKLNGRMDTNGKLSPGYVVTYKFGQGGKVLSTSDEDLNNATDFSAEYTLAKKP